jgi:hypothetical protein
VEREDLLDLLVREVPQEVLDYPDHVVKLAQEVHLAMLVNKVK